VKDIQPPGDKFLSIGTRVCAHWSPQYRCFYPGTVTEGELTSEIESEKLHLHCLESSLCRSKSMSFQLSIKTFKSKMTSILLTIRKQ